ncbi:hypothetical protein [Streptomyces rimosus]|uniref:hypothetical protein n=1 Tax=Streptomyces rimosus TaxID=1927 RepID=UPI0004CBA62E|nr:hypothetical protein [Streptomyces rimosus]
MTVPSYVPIQTSADLTRAMVASPDLPATVTDSLHTAWAARPDRASMMGRLPKGFLQELVTSASTPEGLAALRTEIEAVPDRTITRHVHLLTRDPGRTVTLATLPQSEVSADGYLPQLMDLGEAVVDDQNRATVSNLSEVTFGPLLPGPGTAVITVTHVAVTLTASDGTGRVVSVIELADRHDMRAGESVSIRAGALSCGVG